MKRLIVLIVLLSTAFLTKAQQISIGPTVGFGSSWVTKLGGKSQLHPSWNAGVSFLYSIQPNLGLGADIKLSKEGGKEIFDEGPTDGPRDAKHSVNSNYIRVPLKFVYLFGKNNSPVRPKIYLGPDFGFLTSKKSDFYYEPKGFDFGGVVGAGVNFKLNSVVNLDTDIDYYSGLINTLDNLNIGNDKYNKNLQVNVGLLIHL